MYKSERNPMFRSTFSETIFNNKYAHDGCETWELLAGVLVEDVCGEQMTTEEKQELTRIIADLKFLPGGRYLYYAGRSRKFFNNCLSGDTILATDQGWKRFDSFAEGEAVNVLSPITGTYLPATMHCHGEQPVQRITFAPVRGRSRITWNVDATRTHRWPLIDGSDTYDLRVGDVVPGFQAPAFGLDNRAFVHGLVFADGTKNYERKDKSRVYQLRLCGQKAAYLPLILSTMKSWHRSDADNGDPIVAIESTCDLKAIPADESPEYIASFIRGWLAFDGHHSDIRQIHCIDETAIDWFIENAPWAGLIVSGDKRVETRPTNFGERTPLHYVNFTTGEQWAGFKVVAIEQAGTQKVYCPFEPEHNRIVLKHGIDTYQCYLLRAEEDTREDWANLSWRAESCLMTGGGIGVDYSVYRRSGSVLKGTGGVASGPLPKMMMLNEIGRNVMQGGSRRSAIYASLNWKHGDIQKFLDLKNWYKMPVAGTKASLGEVKENDFNFPAPMDMTNISANYDTAWLLEFWKTGQVGDIFLKNCEQALSTAEPGFSFNFFDKENETLRNACTEVTSEDDSDVCNLGSVNMGRVDSLEEFRTIVHLATKFLVCGTLKAHLPYKKIFDVRQKNRRLGLGLMGVHEWLLKRGGNYQVTEELHRWLEIYRGVSDDSADKFCDSLSISKPVAKRAIAPTGTIGILAGTSTGIEPIFAVAYKRRYLKEGTKWHYQFVVDAAAQELIQYYGLDPDKVESSLDLASDYERRIKFQSDVQDYVDQSISSTINLPRWGSRLNNPDKVVDFANTLAKYAHRLRGFTCYPDGARGGQPLTSVPYSEAVGRTSEEFEESVVETHDVCSITGHGGSCGV